MNDRAQAIAVLKQAREMLAERLTERVLENRDELLEDAAGFSYMSEIEAIYEQLGARLTHVSQMISNLPVPTENAGDAAGDEFEADDQSGSASDVDPGGGNEPIIIGGPLGLKTPALPAPATGELAIGELVATTRPGAFQLFAMQIQAGDVEAAGQTLAGLFGVDEQRGIQCAAVFAQKLENEEGFLPKAMQLRKELDSEGVNGAIMLLYECFGLSGLECIGVLQTLRANFKRN